LNFLIDAQLPPALARWIANQSGHQATHVFDLDLQGADDRVIWEHAGEKDLIIVSKDEDFLDRWLLSEVPVALIWIRKGNCSNRALIAWLDPLWLDVLRRLETGERLIELRG
jgi:predicted nuclease of predicted toxin-antitoxin system